MKRLGMSLCCWITLVSGLAACGSKRNDEAANADPATAPPVCMTGNGGHVKGRLFAPHEIDLDWKATDLECEGMPRPDGAGGRLRFAGPVGEAGARLVLIFGVPDLQAGQTARELDTSVTVIEESVGRFFASAEQSNCWSDINEQQKLAGTDDAWQIQGRVYCLAPLSEVNGDASISLPELSFAGRISWPEPE